MLAWKCPVCGYVTKEYVFSHKRHRIEGIAIISNWCDGELEHFHHDKSMGDIVSGMLV